MGERQNISVLALQPLRQVFQRPNQLVQVQYKRHSTAAWLTYSTVQRTSTPGDTRCPQSGKNVTLNKRKKIPILPARANVQVNSWFDGFVCTNQETCLFTVRQQPKRSAPVDSLLLTNYSQSGVWDDSTYTRNENSFRNETIVLGMKL
jgi:hypothetical protein